MGLTIKSSVIGAGFLMSACASSNVSDGSQALAEADQQICKSQSELGSHMKKTVCRTQAEWDAIDRQGADDMDALTKGPSKVELPTVGR